NVFGDANVSGFRSTNKDNSTCTLVDFTLDDKIVTQQTNQVHYVWDTNLQPGAVFDYTVHWSPEYAAPDGLPKPVMVYWGPNNPPQPGDYVQARDCVSPVLPHPYGQVAGPIAGTADNAAIKAGSTDTISVTASVTLPPQGYPFPFPIQIGGQPKSEQMVVNSVVSGSFPNYVLGVTRGRGLATNSNVPSHSVSDYVMSTGLPLDGAGLLMQVCILKQTSQPVTPDKCAGLP